MPWYYHNTTDINNNMSMLWLNGSRIVEEEQNIGILSQRAIQIDTFSDSASFLHWPSFKDTPTLSAQTICSYRCVGISLSAASGPSRPRRQAKMNGERLLCRAEVIIIHVQFTFEMNGRRLRAIDVRNWLNASFLQALEIIPTRRRKT